MRLLLPPGLRRYEALWVLPVGACVCAIALTLLGYAYVPHEPAIAIVVVAGLALAVYALRRTPGAPGIVPALWPSYVALILAAIALIPLFRAGFATVEGEGQDAHLAVGTAQFLQNHHPTEIAPEEPVDRVPLVWRSKPPIYYALGANATLAGKEPFEAISTQAALLLALSAFGFFLVARELLRAPPWVAVIAMALVGLDRMVLHTIMHPYFNQTWGFMTLPFALVLAWWAVHERTRGGLFLLALFLAVGAFAYPLMLPIPLIALAIWLWPERRRFSPRRLWRGPRSLVWMVPIGALLLIPLGGVIEKLASGAKVAVDPTHSLETWGGDLLTFYEEAWFFALPTGAALLVAAPFLLYGGRVALRAVPPVMARGLLAVIVFAAVFAVWFRFRDYGYYFHFKILAFVAPLAVAVAAVGLGRLRHGWVALGVFVLLALGSANSELGVTFDQLPRTTLELRTLTRDVPRGESIRLDVDPQQQNWAAYMLHQRRLCSQRPLEGTSYPHVRRSRKADFIVTEVKRPKPIDAIGDEPVRRLTAWTLWRADPAVPGPDRCSQRMVQTVTTVDFG